MSKWLTLSLIVLPYLAPATSGAIARDHDHDGLPDRWERRHHLSTSKPSAKGDPDRDGLRNRREYRLRTNPRKRDTDGDGLRDRAEIRRYHTNPRKKDTDGDGLRDGAEIRRYHTNPRKKDTDGDGFGDGAEVRAGTNPRDRNSHPSASQAPGAPGPSGPPDASSTGVPPGTTLTPSGPLTITTTGAVIDRREISGQVVVNAPNVTIRNSRIRSNAMWVVDNNSTGLVIEDSEIINQPVSGKPNCHNGIGNSNLTVRRTEITGCENALNIDGPGNVTFVDNYVHDLDVVGPSWVFGTSGPHTDGIQMQEGGANLVIRHNWISPQDSGTPASTSAIIMHHLAGVQNSNAWIEDNYLDGSHASYALYAPRSQTHDVYINRNRMYKGYGYTACVRLGVTVSAFQENRDAGTDALISPDNGAGGSCSN
jgi:hypothetical protein